jgi:hypothetical protein
MATCVTSRSLSQSDKASSAFMLPPKLRVSYAASAPGTVMRTHATIRLEWTSKPAHLS